MGYKEYFTECGKLFLNGRTCSSQVAVWSDEPRGYFCSHCGKRRAN